MHLLHLRPRLPAPLGAIVHRLLVKDPGQRLADAAPLIAALDRFGNSGRADPRKIRWPRPASLIPWSAGPRALLQRLRGRSRPRCARAILADEPRSHLASTVALSE